MTPSSGKRGLKFHYSVNGEGDIPRTTTTPWWTTTTEPITDENGSTVTFTTTTTTTTTRETTTTQPTGTNPAGYPTAPPRPDQDPSAFPLPDPSVDARCGLSFAPAEIVNFDYRHQDEYVRGVVDEWNPNFYSEISPKVINGEIAVPHRKDFILFWLFTSWLDHGSVETCSESKKVFLGK